MAKFTDAETTLIQGIKDDRLRTSLARIREAVEDIWAPDTPRIIQDYTDHGIQHVERLARWAVELTKANGGLPLTTYELYILIAGIYLHDVGMQCDVVNLPELKAKAETFGATFGLDFTARGGNSYSLAEQQAIRKNHHYLSIAWIDHASRTGETLLGDAAKTIPEGGLVDDLMDVCVHHTKLPISNCPDTFKFLHSERKRLVAALLRFSDELDIDSRRVSSIETIRTFSLNPANEVFWWLHNRTNISFVARNLVVITIRLNPEDLRKYGSFVHTAFITEFQTKNQPVLTILSSNGIPIVISSDSKIVPDDRAGRLPAEIGYALQSLQKKKSDPLIAVADEIRTWLQSTRYELTECPHTNAHTLDMLAMLNQGSLQQRVLVRCVDGEISREDIEQVETILDRKTPQAWLISDKRVSPGARERCSNDEGIQVFTLSEFLSQKVWRSYFDALRSLTERDQIPSLYVDIGCYRQLTDKEGGELAREHYKSLDQYIDTWLKERGKIHISLLGEFGGGKTWFCRHYAYLQLQRYINDPVGERLPLLITLRTFTKATTPQQLINDALLEQYKLPFLGSAFDVFEEMNRRGKLLLLLDGFDEMARQVDYQTVVDNFWQLAELVDESSKVILTSRTEYFRWVKESQKILSGEEYGRRTIILQPPKFDVLHLEAFTDSQVHEVIIKRAGEVDGPALAEKILKSPNLAEMARKPILIELLLAVLEEVSTDVLDNPAQVYLFATNKLLLRNIDNQRTFTTTADKLFFLCELAWEMIKTGDLKIHYAAIPDRIKAYFGERIKDQHELDTWDYDLRNQTLLHRNAAGYYEFAHKSLAEYFVALKFSAELGLLDSIFLKVYFQEGQKSLLKTIKHISELTESFGAIPLRDQRMEAVYKFLLEMLVRNHDRLWTLLNDARALGEEQDKHTSSNLLCLLVRTEADLSGRDLSNLRLLGDNLLDLIGFNLAGTKFSNSKFQETYLELGYLNGADFSGAELVPTGLIPDISDTSGKGCGFLNNDCVVAVGWRRLHLWSIVDDKTHEEFPFPIELNNVLGLGIAYDDSTVYLQTYSHLFAWSRTLGFRAILNLKSQHYQHELTVSRQRPLLATFSDSSVFDGKHDYLLVLDQTTDSTLASIDLPAGAFGAVFANHSDQIWIGGRDGMVRSYNFRTGSLVGAINRVELGEPNYIYSLALSPDDSTLVIGTTHSALILWDVQANRPKAQISIKPIYSVKISSDGKYVGTISTMGEVSIIEMASQEVLYRSKQGHCDRIDFSPDARYFAMYYSTHQLSKVTVLSLQTMENIITFPLAIDLSTMNISNFIAPIWYLRMFRERGAFGSIDPERLWRCSREQLLMLLMGQGNPNMQGATHEQLVIMALEISSEVYSGDV